MTEVAVETPTYRHYIAGEWCDSTSGETFESRNPANRNDVIGRFQQGTKADVAMAVSAAWAARPMWQRTPAPKRGEILFRFAQLMADNKERLSQAMTREMGKVIAEARGDVQEGIDIAFLMAGEGRRMHGDTVPSELPDKWAMSIRQPIGFAGIITPWNFPMAIPCWKMMPALVTGNVVVFKPSSDTPHCATLLVELLAEAGIPPGSRQRCGSVKLRIPIGAGIYRAERDARDNEPDSRGTVGQVVRLAEDAAPLELELYVPTFAQPRRAISFGANPSGRETAPKYPSCLSS